MPNKFEGFVTEKPKKTGLYDVLCSENNYKSDRVAISVDYRGFVVHSEDIGESGLDAYHDGLENINWKRIA